MGRVGPKQEGKGSIEPRSANDPQYHPSERDMSEHAFYETSGNDRKANNPKQDEGEIIVEAQSSMGCFQAILVLAIIAFAIGFPVYVIVMAFMGGIVPYVNYEFEGTVGEGLIALVAAPILFFVLLLPLTLFPKSKKSRADKRFGNRGVDKYR